MAFVVTVSQINRRLALLIKDDKQIQSIAVKGELSNFVEHYKSGHIYFTLCDGDASIKGVMFRSYAEKLGFDPENGMNIIVTGSVQLYERDGTCQIIAVGMERDEGIGEGAETYEQIKQKLLKEGLFEQKRPLPDIPKSICVVTSETGAAIKDILNVLSRRYPFVKVKLIPVLVQGTEAPQSIAKGLYTAQHSGCDIIIFGRGGGSSEDLSAFNTEVVARAVYASKIPTISAVGHEIDYSISDFVADMRAPTPSAAAEIAVPDISVIKRSIEEQKKRIKEKALIKIEGAQSKVNSTLSAISFYNPKNR
ncbi:MAG: exodeoxyribonuclease VII large subunit, partial [[Eubacterium] siraeum]|nr:exodeoxyribonuclease VII large subunit [[Eubacterium] siraeum]